MDYIVLSCVFYIWNGTIRMGRVVLGSLFGSFCASVIVVVWGVHLSGWQLLVHLVVNPMMTLIVFRKSSWLRFLKEVLSIYVVTALFAGMIQFIYITTLQSRLFLLSVFSSAFLLLGIIKSLKDKKRVQQFSYEVNLKNQGQQWMLHGFYDSGNFLMDPYVNRPVSLLDAKTAEGMNLSEMPKRMIPYLAVGSQNDFLEAVTFEKMEIMKDGEHICIERPVLAISKENLFGKRKFDLILNPMLFQNET